MTICGGLKHLVDKGLIEKSAQGVYVLSKILNDEIFDLHNRFKRGVFSLETALFLWDLTDRMPNAQNMLFPVSYNRTKPKTEGIKCVQRKWSWYELGITGAFTSAGN